MFTKNNLCRVAIALLAVAALAGCGSVPKQLPPETKYEVVTPPVSLMQLCSITPPPDKQAFIDADEKERVRLLQGLSSDLYSDLKTCNKHWKALKAWYANQGKIYSE
jgi:predicted small lipoprotein YifL